MAIKSFEMIKGERDKRSIMEFSHIMRENVNKEIFRGVIRQKLSKMRHLVITQAILSSYLDDIFSKYILPLFAPQTVTYNGGVAQIKQWKISCYLEVMEGGVPCAMPCVELRNACLPLLDACNTLFAEWYLQQHSCNVSRDRTAVWQHNQGKIHEIQEERHIGVRRLMTFITRYTPAPGEQALLKVRFIPEALLHFVIHPYPKLNDDFDALLLP